MSFVTEFRKNIPYIADGMGEFIIEGLQELNIPLIAKTPKQWEAIVKEIHNKIESKVQEALTDWLNEYQSSEAGSKQYDNENIE